MKRLAETIVESLKGHPALLGLVLLNMAFIGAALFFLNSLGQNAAQSRDRLMQDNAKHFELLFRLCAPRYGEWEP